MANFSVGTKVSTTEDSVSVDVTPAAAIPPGVHHFQLIVVDDAGNESDPATAQVVVRDSVRPTAVLGIAPSQVQPGASFKLDGTKSSDVAPGKLVQFIWTMID
jgi:hypothetical protein